LPTTNIWTDAGETLVRNYVDASATAPSTWYIGWGTGAGTAAKTDTTLFTEASESRVAATKSTPAADQNRFVGELTADGTKTITNAGVLTASTVGTLFVKSSFDGIALDAGDKINFTWTLTWS
jgi:hypothetical protein